MNFKKGDEVMTLPINVDDSGYEEFVRRLEKMLDEVMPFLKVKLTEQEYAELAQAVGMIALEKMSPYKGA